MSDPRTHTQIEDAVKSTQARENFFKRIRAGALGQQAALYRLDEVGKWFNPNPYSFFTKPLEYGEFEKVLADTITLIEEGKISGYRKSGLPDISERVPEAEETGYFRNISGGFMRLILVLNP